MSSNKGKAMTTIGLWKCDICHKEFRSDRRIDGILYNDYDGNVSLTITIPGCDGISNVCPKIYTFKDTCLDCRIELCAVIEGLLERSHAGYHEE